jgi:hypothetical protein
MPTRSQVRIRRDLNRLDALLAKHEDQPALAVLRVDVSAAAWLVNRSFQFLQEAAVTGDRERNERDAAVEKVRNWVQQWRPVVLIKIPAAAANVRQLPARGATPDDQIRVAEDLRNLIATNPGAESFRDAALEALGDRLEQAARETNEATSALPAEAGAQAALTEATLSGNELLVRALDIVRAVFGPTSPEYRQFMMRSTSDTDAEEEDREVEVGEGASTTSAA